MLKECISSLENTIALIHRSGCDGGVVRTATLEEILRQLKEKYRVDTVVENAVVKDGKNMDVV